MESAVREAARRMGYFPLKEEQEASIMAFLKGCDVFVVLPTGFGKTVCYSCILVAVDLYTKPRQKH